MKDVTDEPRNGTRWSKQSQLVSRAGVTYTSQYDPLVLSPVMFLLLLLYATTPIISYAILSLPIRFVYNPQISEKLKYSLGYDFKIRGVDVFNFFLCYFK